MKSGLLLLLLIVTLLLCVVNSAFIDNSDTVWGNEDADVIPERHRRGLQPDCFHIYASRKNPLKDGMYSIQPPDSKTPIRVYCEMDRGTGWLVIQRRMDGTLDFLKPWTDYEFGFGDPRQEFWIGNDQLHRITAQEPYEMRIELTDFTNRRAYADYMKFQIGNSSTLFELTVAGFFGSRGDSLKQHNKMPFSTVDFDNDKSAVNCAKVFLGAWWYNDCMASNLNGHYNDTVSSHGVVWETWKDESLKMVVMKIRPARRKRRELLQRRRRLHSATNI